MVIDIKVNNDVPFIPDIEDNRKKPEGQQWRIILRRLSTYQVQNECISVHVVNGEATGVINRKAAVQLSVRNMVNPPILRDEEGNETTVTLRDVMTRPELSDVAEKLETQVIKLIGEGKPEKKVKN